MPLDPTAQAAGLEAIKQALARLYPKQEAHSSKTKSGAQDESNALLDGISAFRSQSQKSHWHYITFGLSELFEKESVNTESSGFGLELTFRLLSTDESPPHWPFEFLHSLASEIFQSGNAFEIGHSLVFQPAISVRKGLSIEAIVVTADKELGQISTPNGLVEFRQILLITKDEYELLKNWRMDRFITSLSANLGHLLISNPDRLSIAQDKTVLAERDADQKSHGASKSVLHSPSTEWIFTYKAMISLAPDVVPEFKQLLAARIKRAEDLTIVGEGSIVFRPAAKAAFTIDDTALIISLTAADAEKLINDLENKKGPYSITGLPLDIEIVEAG